jgi:hypothetical protein
LDNPPQILLDSGIRVGALLPETDLLPPFFQKPIINRAPCGEKDTFQKSISFYNKTIEELNKVNLVFLSQNTRIFAANPWIRGQIGFSLCHPLACALFWFLYIALLTSIISLVVKGGNIRRADLEYISRRLGNQIKKRCHPADDK